MTELTLDQFWECPRCGFQVAMGEPAKMSPPHCTWGHPRTEMEQKTAEAFGRRDVA